jgi:hypothetical protein
MTQEISVRKPSTEDVDRLKQCLAADGWHSAQDPAWWVSAPGELLVFVDERGHRVFARLEHAIRVHLQHDQDVPKLSTARILRDGSKRLRQFAAQAGVVELLFDSRAEKLIKFCAHLGFKPLRDNFSISVTPEEKR